ncbi:12372_t:CDS:2, partial [Racocetra fulgida]
PKRDNNYDDETNITNTNVDTDSSSKILDKRYESDCLDDINNKIKTRNHRERKIKEPRLLPVNSTIDVELRKNGIENDETLEKLRDAAPGNNE